MPSLRGEGRFRSETFVVAVRDPQPLALRPGAVNGSGPAFGMLVLASPDPQRFQAGFATDFLERIAELASAALSRLRPR